MPQSPELRLNPEIKVVAAPRTPGNRGGLLTDDHEAKKNGNGYHADKIENSKPLHNGYKKEKGTDFYDLQVRENPRNQKKKGPEDLSDYTWRLDSGTYDPEQQPGREVIHSVANGYVGMRASVDKQKGEVHQPAAYIAGLYATPERPNDPAVPELVRIPDFHFFGFNNGTEPFDIDKAHAQGGLLGYSETTDLKKGVHHRNFKWRDSSGKITDIKMRQFLSHADSHLGDFQFSITPVNYEGPVSIETGIDGRIDNKGAKLLSEKGKGIFDDRGIYYAASTDEGKLVSIASKVNITSGQQPLDGIEVTTTEEPDTIAQRYGLFAKKGQTVTFQKVIGIHSSLDQERLDQDDYDPVHASQITARQAHSDGAAARLKDHVTVLDKKWGLSDIQVEGDPRLQRDVRYNAYKLISLGSTNPDVSIAAKGLDNLPGRGYKGHVFWDHEVFALPFYLDAAPDQAKAQLMYRLNRGEPARQKAQANGYEGWLFPWESADTGEEATPEYGIDEKGNKIKIYNGKREFHINSHVAGAGWDYMRDTGDTSVLPQVSQMTAETARMWVSKAIQDSSKDPDGYSIKGVISADEYHEKGPDGKIGVNDSFFNNTRAQRNIDLAGMYWDKFAKDRPQLQQAMGVDQKTIDDWRKVGSDLRIFYIDKDRQIFDEFEGFSSLKPLDLSQFNGDVAVDGLLRVQGKSTCDYMVVKQADVLQALIMNGETNQRILVNNYNYYSPMTSHGSSLSDGTHAIAAVRAGYMDRARDHVEKSGRVDIDDTKERANEGTHVASMGNTLRAMKEGYGGIIKRDDHVYVQPRLDDRISKLSYSTRFGGQRIRITETHDAMTIMAPSEENRQGHTWLNVGGDFHRLDTGSSRTFSYDESKPHPNPPKEHILYVPDNKTRTKTRV